MRRHRWPISLGAICALIIGCDRVDPLSVEDNGSAKLIDYAVGESGRKVCVRLGHGNEHCPFRVRAVPKGGQLAARWRHARVVEIFLFGGEVAQCAPSLPGTPYSVELRQIADASKRGNSWSDQDFGAFRGVPDTCSLHS
jgi:hypothetical protein